MTAKPPQYLTIQQIIEIHELCVRHTGGISGIRDRKGLDSAVALPGQGFGEVEFYPTLADKAAVLGHSLILNHPFLDGNKRTGFMAMEVFLLINGFEIREEIEAAELVILDVAAGRIGREEFTDWLRTRVHSKIND